MDLDIDNQSIARWSHIREASGATPIPTFAPTEGETLEAAFERACTAASPNDGPHVIIVDLPGRPRRDLPTTVYRSLAVAYVPLEPTLMVAGASRRLLVGYQSDGPAGPIVRPIVNRYRSELRRTEAVTMIGDNIVASVAVRDYAVHRDSYERGLGVTEYAPDHHAAADMRSIAADMRGVCRGLAERKVATARETSRPAQHGRGA